MRRSLAIAAVAIVLSACSSASDKPDNLAALDDIQAHRSGQEVTVEGTVVQVLPTITSPEGRHHERFVLDIHTGSGDEQLVLVAHNIDVAPYVPLQPDDDVILRGELEIDRTGPVIHYTHRDPSGRHQPGFIKAHDHTYD